MDRPRALYIHIPFCRRKCLYCDFYSVAGREDLREPYITALMADVRWHAAACGPLELDTVYVGGGTPSVLPPGDIGRLLDALGDQSALASDAEVTCECNPGTVSLASLQQLRSAGVNRLSIGVQSLVPGDLGFLGRIHSADEGRRAVHDAQEAGFANVSIDLIYCLPGQTPAAWSDALSEAIALKPDHASPYCLQIEPGTPLAALVERGEVTPLPEDDQAALYALTQDLLEAAGLRQYEISNFGRAGLECRHNLAYWRNEAYIGLGAGAWSFVDGERRQQIAHVGAYIEAWAASGPRWAYRERCTGVSAANETLMMALRTTEGLSLDTFRARHGIDLRRERAAEVADLAARGLVSVDGGRLRAARAGMALVDEITARLALAEKE
jgi:putative oxygen-independent coproporphyrinogen III oxidase